MQNKLLTLIFVVTFTNGFGQDLDSVVVIRDYFSKGQASQRHPPRFNRTDSVVHLGSFLGPKLFRHTSKRFLFLIISRTYSIDGIDVTEDQFINEKIEFERATY